jgi:hypothetical protein
MSGEDEALSFSEQDQKQLDKDKVNQTCCYVRPKNGCLLRNNLDMCDCLSANPLTFFSTAAENQAGK